MTQPKVVTVAPSVLRLFRTLLISASLMVVGIFGIAVSLVGLGDWTIVTCVVLVTLSVILYILAAVRQRPRLDITPERFSFEKLFGCESHRWDEIDGQFVVIKVGWNDAVAYQLTPEYKARTGRRPTSLFSGYDAAIVGSTLSRSASEIAELLNEHLQINQASGQAVVPKERIVPPGTSSSPDAENP